MAFQEKENYGIKYLHLCLKTPKCKKKVSEDQEILVLYEKEDTGKNEKHSSNDNMLSYVGFYSKVVPG